MNRIIVAISVLTLCMSCSTPTPAPEGVKFNRVLADELRERAKLDQTAAGIPEGRLKAYTREEWKAYKDSVFMTNKVFLEEVLDTYGYPGYDLVGEECSSYYWLMAQHCDFDPAFQRRVLDQLKKQVEAGNANGRNYALLTDRVNINTNKKQVYGTQVTYVKETGQAIPKPLQDSLTVNERRRTMGFQPIEAYLNRMTQRHFDINKDNMLKRGITAPKLYVVPASE